MIHTKTIPLLALILLLSGCIVVTGDGDGDWDDSSNWRSEQDRNLNNINKLMLGQLRSTVISQMGEPNLTEAFQAENGSNYQILYYRTHHEHSDGKTTRDETTALVFENDKLVGWGNDALQRIH